MNWAKKRAILSVDDFNFPDERIGAGENFLDPCKLPPASWCRIVDLDDELTFLEVFDALEPFGTWSEHRDDFSLKSLPKMLLNLNLALKSDLKRCFPFRKVWRERGFVGDLNEMIGSQSFPIRRVSNFLDRTLIEHPGNFTD